jgi:hypothetical protein
MPLVLQDERVDPYSDEQGGQCSADHEPRRNCPKPDCDGGHKAPIAPAFLGGAAKDGIVANPCERLDHLKPLLSSVPDDKRPSGVPLGETRDMDAPQPKGSQAPLNPTLRLRSRQRIRHRRPV